MKLRLTKTMQDVQWAFIGLAISSLVHFLLRVVLGRELGASGLGLYTLVFTIYMFGMQFAAFGIGAALPRYIPMNCESLEKIREFITKRTGKGSMILFASHKNNLFEAYVVHERVRNLLVVDTSPYIRPVVEILDSYKDVGLILHLSASTSLGPDPNEKVLVASVEEAIKLGADAVSIHVNIGSNTETAQLKRLGEISRCCREWGMPLLAMMYPRGEGINQFDEKAVALAARVGAELGADIVKTNFTGSVESFRRVVEGCPVPVVVAGGEKMDSNEDILKMVEMAVEAGAAGVAIGRNIFQAESPRLMTKAISMIVHDNVGWEDALEILK